MSVLWGGRFSDAPADALMAFTESASFDHVLLADDCAVLAAHARRLAGAGILSDDEAAAIAGELDAIVAQPPMVEPGDEDIHSTVERALLVRLPEAGAKVRAGLSRNDRVVTATRRWLRREGRTVLDEVLALIGVLDGLAEQHAGTLMPGYTHLQRAQPITLGHHLLAHAFALSRDAGRFTDALARADESALGAGALAGSTLGLDADASAADLGFARAMANSLDAVAARDFIAEFLSAAAICGVHLSRIGEELVLWTSSEFGFATPADAYATGSSLMPQKRNPDVAELARGKAGRLIGDLAGLLATLKGLPLAYNRDLQEDKEPLFDAVRSLKLMIPALRGMLETLTFHPDAMTAALDPGATATDVAESLVHGGMSFRDAHEEVGRRVADGTLEAVDPRGSVAARGGLGPGTVAAQRERLARELRALRG